MSQSKPKQIMTDIIDGIRVTVRYTPPTDLKTRESSLRELCAGALARQARVNAG